MSIKLQEDIIDYKNKINEHTEDDTILLKNTIGEKFKSFFDPLVKNIDDSVKSLR